MGWILLIMAFGSNGRILSGEAVIHSEMMQTKEACLAAQQSIVSTNYAAQPEIRVYCIDRSKPDTIYQSTRVK